MEGVFSWDTAVVYLKFMCVRPRSLSAGPTLRANSIKFESENDPNAGGPPPAAPPAGAHDPTRQQSRQRQVLGSSFFSQRPSDNTQFHGVNLCDKFTTARLAQLAATRNEVSYSPTVKTLQLQIHAYGVGPDIQHATREVIWTLPASQKRDSKRYIVSLANETDIAGFVHQPFSRLEGAHTSTSDVRRLVTWFNPPPPPPNLLLLRDAFVLHRRSSRRNVWNTCFDDGNDGNRRPSLPVSGR